MVFGEIFAPIYPSQVSPKLCLLCRGVVEEEAFTQREREREQQAKTKMKKTKKWTKSKELGSKKNNKQLSWLGNSVFLFSEKYCSSKLFFLMD